MADEPSDLTREAVREEAREILLALDASRISRLILENNWRKLWQLAREARAASLAIEASDGPWYLDHSVPLSPILSADKFRIPIWPPQGGGLGTDLAILFNWAGVPVPDAR